MLTDTEADSDFAKLRVTNARIERDGERLWVLAVSSAELPDAIEE